MASKMLVKKNAENKLATRFNALPPILVRKDYSVSLSAIGFLGVFSGLIAGLFGIGGGIIKTPVMINIFKMPAKNATATALFMIVFTSLTASVSHWSYGRLNWSLALPIASAFFVGSLLGNQLNKKMSADKIKLILGWMMLFAGIFILLHSIIIDSFTF